jgi:hypothetical protein
MIEVYVVTVPYEEPPIAIFSSDERAQEYARNSGEEVYRYVVDQVEEDEEK